MNGVIKKIVSDKAFGFITVPGREKDLFFHKESVVGGQFEDLREGDSVTFEEISTEKGPAAKDVQKA